MGTQNEPEAKDCVFGGRKSTLSTQVVQQQLTRRPPRSHTFIPQYEYPPIKGGNYNDGQVL